jgi:hypothetical protein
MTFAAEEPGQILRQDVKSSRFDYATEIYLRSRRGHIQRAKLLAVGNF